MVLGDLTDKVWGGDTDELTNPFVCMRGYLEGLQCIHQAHCVGSHDVVLGLQALPAPSHGVHWLKQFLGSRGKELEHAVRYFVPEVAHEPGTAAIHTVHVIHERCFDRYCAPN